MLASCSEQMIGGACRTGSREGFQLSAAPMKLAWVLPACFQVNQVRKPFLNAITCRFQCIKHMKNQIIKISNFDSDGDFMRFVRRASKTGFATILIKTAVHRTQNIRLCGRHRFSVFNRFAISCRYHTINYHDYKSHGL